MRLLALLLLTDFTRPGNESSGLCIVVLLNAATIRDVCLRHFLYYSCPVIVYTVSFAFQGLSYSEQLLFSRNIVTIVGWSAPMTVVRCFRHNYSRGCRTLATCNNIIYESNSWTVNCFQLPPWPRCWLWMIQWTSIDAKFSTVSIYCYTVTLCLLIENFCHHYS
jgi:hypothetical protein